MKLPKITLTASPEHQRRRLALWLKEWEADTILRLEAGKERPLDQIPSATEGGNADGPARINILTKPVRVGQVRLLRPATGGGAAHRPVYVVVLEKNRKEAFLIAPFGRFAEPAVPGEWLTGLKALPLRVLCLWNSRIIAADILDMSWPADRIKPERLRQALEVHRFFRSGTPLASVPDKDIGPPLRHPLDPRLEYQAEEAAALDESLMATEKELNAQISDGDHGSAVYEISGSEMRLAAESHATYGRSRRRRKGKGK